MDYAGLVARHGYAAVFAGALIEDETVVALAGHLFGELLGRLLDELRLAEAWVFGAGATLAVVFAVRRWLSRRAARTAGANDGS